MPEKSEDLISTLSFSVVGLHFAGVVLFIVYWLFSGHEIISHNYLTLYKTTDYDFFIDLYFDRITAVYLFVGAFLTFLVTIYSRYYLHREDGYKRFFNTLLFFYLGYNVAVLSGNLETLFIGWEILGMSSFLLISFLQASVFARKKCCKSFFYLSCCRCGIDLGDVDEPSSMA